MANKRIPLLSFLLQKDEITPSDAAQLRAKLSNVKEMLEVVKELSKPCYTFAVDEDLIPSLKKNLNFVDLSLVNCTLSPAVGGYLNINVQQYFYIRHRIRLRYPYLPPMACSANGNIEYYPLELVTVSVN